MSSALFSATMFLYFYGTNYYLIMSPFFPSKIYAFSLIMSITPFRLSSSPIGTWTAAQVSPNLYLREVMAGHGLAPILSNLLIKMILGTLYLFICLLTVSVCGCTPPTPQTNSTAPSRTLRALST